MRLEERVDQATVEAYREAMRRDVERTGGKGWQLVGGIYDGSVFPESAQLPSDRILAVPVSRDMVVCAMYVMVDGKVRRGLYQRLIERDVQVVAGTAEQTQAVAAPQTVSQQPTSDAGATFRLAVGTALEAVGLAAVLAGRWLGRKV